MIVIGLAGLLFDSGNYGCAALAISFYKGLTEILGRNHEECRIIAFSGEPNSKGLLEKEYPIQFVKYRLSNLHSVLETRTCVKQCDVMIDFTEGDSFSDIYGNGRFIKDSVIKMMALHYHVPLLLGPQTYGPFVGLLCRKTAAYIVNRAQKVYTRDKLSAKYLIEMGITRKVNICTDVAFRLPFAKVTVPQHEALWVGVNVSGLLWADCAGGRNKYGLTIHYIKYHQQLIQNLLRDPQIKVYLIPHVGTQNSSENGDYYACRELQKKYPSCAILNDFANPCQAKEKISTMDVFVGARMHATIAALSAGVFTIPIAYSRKFEGLFSSLGYPVIIDGCALNTEQAVEKTMYYIQAQSRYREKVKTSGMAAQKMLNEFYADIECSLKDYHK